MVILLGSNFPVMGAFIIYIHIQVTPWKVGGRGGGGRQQGGLVQRLTGDRAESRLYYLG